MMIDREERENIALLRMNHGKVNAMDLDFLGALIAALDGEEASSARAVVLTGAGTAFSAGVDLFQIVSGGAAYVREFLPLLSAALTRLLVFPKPLVAAVNGHAIAGGHLAMAACDRRLLAAGGAKLGVPELRVGVPFPPVALEILRLASPGCLQELVYTGRTFGAEEALARGLVHEVVAPERLLTRAEEIANELASFPAEAFRMTKRAVVAPVLERTAKLEAELGAEIAAAWEAPRTIEDIRAYLDRTVGRRG
jgi:enoyl-CoA hydratase